jgi:hypothetical protein
MKGQGVRGEFERVSDRSSGHAFPSCFDKKAKNIKTIVLRESGQSRQSLVLFHISVGIEMSTECQEIISRKAEIIMRLSAFSSCHLDMVAPSIIGDADDSAAAFTRPRSKRAFNVGHVASRCSDDGCAERWRRRLR